LFQLGDDPGKLAAGRIATFSKRVVTNSRREAIADGIVTKYGDDRICRVPRIRNQSLHRVRWPNVQDDRRESVRERGKLRQRLAALLRDRRVVLLDRLTPATILALVG
jgi:hypothetical protein